MGAVKAYPYSNKQNETVYFYTDNDSNSRPLFQSRNQDVADAGIG